MYDRIFLLKAYINYWLVREDQYSLQSPFVFKIHTGLQKFIENSLNQDPGLEDYRKQLLRDHQLLDIEDFGAGSKKLKTRSRTTCQITKYSTSGRKFSMLYQYFCSLTPAFQVIELGTCMGISTRYLSQSIKGTIYTFEGSIDLYRKAQEHFPPSNIKFVLGDITDTLPAFLMDVESIDFALIDATHTYEGTLNYFKLILPYLHAGSILAIADIHWSSGMEKAWEEIKASPAIKLSLDYFECGILFFSEEIPKSHYVLNI